ncbi:hypothetical protein FKR81_06600 [Lentzea tibetensis]|uniref:AlgX/AlgJ SGNH hydrolase-like domain-containing protein n=1 Tax=Lentzea tibetensis TaxID=2591470 RepID=A0A563F0A5_9PSEU|nr:hypothetical protein [Lentzea tibetensis]TWP52794.1 hypothetical protein FKR81_06600 [Lentzea tibetensis]
MTAMKQKLPPAQESWLPREHPLYRPRHGTTQRLALIAAVVFFLLPSVAFVFGVRPGAFENRALTPFPGILQGWGFLTQLNPWATDHLALREQAVHLNDLTSRGIFGEQPAVQRNNAGPIDKTETPPPRPVINFPPVVEGKNGWLYLGDELASHCSPSRPIKETVGQLRKLRDEVEASGRRFAVVVAPDKATLYPENLPDNMDGKDCQRKGAEEFWQAVSAEDYVVDVRDELHSWGRMLGEPVYGPLDAHWGEEAGVIVSRQLAERFRKGISKPWVVNPGETWEQNADLPVLIGRSGVTTGRRYAILPDGKRDTTNRDVPIDFKTKPLHFDSASGPGTYGFSVGLLGDSFTIRTLRYLSGTFGDITIGHHGEAFKDGGKVAGQVMAENTTVVVEVAERTLMSGKFTLTQPDIQRTVVDQLKARPIR